MPAKRASARQARSKVKGMGVETSKNEIRYDPRRNFSDEDESDQEVVKRTSRKHLGAALKSMEDKIRKRELQAERGCWPEIKRRLMKMGWTEDDMPFGWSADGKAWHKIVSQPGPLTEQIWADIQPRLIHLLERNREDLLQEERDDREYQRHYRLYELLRDIQVKHSLTLRPEVYNELSRHSSEVVAPRFTFRGPFPDLGHILDWPLVKNLHTTDIGSEEMEARFEENREEIESLIAEWKERIQAHLASLLRDGYKRTGEALRPIIAVCDKDTGPLASASDDLKLLLRADTFFYKTSDPSKRPLSYSAVLSREGLKPQVCLFGPAGSRKSSNLDDIRWYPEAHKAARDILAGLGKPDLTYLNMDFFGKLVCGKCHDTLHRSWEKMVQHYVEQNQLHTKIHEDESYLFGRGITYNNIHDPAVLAGCPMVMQYFTKVVGLDARIGPLQMCRVCERIPAAEHVIAPMSRILKHLRDVHGITEPEADEHYLLRTVFDDDPYEIKDYESGDSYRAVYGRKNRYDMEYSDNEEEEDVTEETDDGGRSSTDQDGWW